MKLLVTGGRKYGEFDEDDPDKDWRAEAAQVLITLDRLHAERRFTQVIQGRAAGADRWARVWGEQNGILVRSFPARWREHGLGAGPVRNREMYKLSAPDLVVAFPGGNGTADMVRVAKNGGTEVIEVGK